MTQLAKKKILIVDDMPENIRLLMEIFSHEYIILAAKTGEKALQLALSGPDLILLDVIMPGLGGYETCKRLKANAYTQHIPVIFVTVLDATEDEAQGLLLGAVDYITKPFKPEIIRTRVKNHITLQASLQESKKLWQCVEQSASSVVITDAQGHIEYVNPFFAQITGYMASEALGQKTSLLKSGQHDQQFYANLWKTITAGKVWRGEILNKKKDGTLLWEQMNIAPIKNTTGLIEHYIAIKQDISDKKELERIKEDVEKMMRHDLKTPLNGIIGLPQVLLMMDNLTHEQQRLLQMIEDSGMRMLKMIDISLILFKIETGNYAYHAQDVDVKEIILTIMTELQTRMALKHITLQLRTDGLSVQTPFLKNVSNDSSLRISQKNWKESERLPDGIENDTPFVINGDELLLYSMLSNLILNAFEASPDQAQIYIDLMTSPFSISITNKGAVPASIKHHFFEKYKTFGKQYGTGLGTYSANLIARAMGYTLELEVDYEQDTTTLRLCHPS